MTLRIVPLGTVAMTPAAEETLCRTDVLLSLERHATGDWGDVCEEDRQENELALRAGFRLLSSYRDSNGTRFWIITEADRSVTTVLLPDDY